MPEQTPEQMVITSAIRTLAFIERDKLRIEIRKHEAYIQHVNGIGPIIDPTGYRNALQDGTLEDARYQLQLAQKVLELLDIVHEREAHVQKYRNQDE